MSFYLSSSISFLLIYRWTGSFHHTKRPRRQFHKQTKLPPNQSL